MEESPWIRTRDKQQQRGWRDFIQTHDPLGLWSRPFGDWHMQPPFQIPWVTLFARGWSWGRYVTSINLKTKYLIKVSCNYLLFPGVFFFLTLPDNSLSPDGETLLDSICDTHHFWYAHSLDPLFVWKRVGMSVERTCCISQWIKFDQCTPTPVLGTGDTKINYISGANILVMLLVFLEGFSWV